MSLQWTCIAGCLYFEIGVVIILMLPIASPTRWYRFFNSRLFLIFRDRGAMYFYMLQGVLALFMLDAIREMRKYSSSSDGGHVHISSEMKGTVKLFRAQRNFYITGFAIFLAFVIHRLVKMIIAQAKLLERYTNTVKESAIATNRTQYEKSKLDLKIKEYQRVSKQLEATEVLLIETKEKNDLLKEELLLLKSNFEQTKESGKGDVM